MSEKRKLILHFGLDCLLIVLYFLTMATHISQELGPVVCLCFVFCHKLFSPKKPEPKKRERELTTAEVIAVFAIVISAFYILYFTKAFSLIFSTSFIIPMGIIVLAIRLLYFSKNLAALQTSKPASN